MASRYDGIADWYDTEFQPLPLQSETWDVLRRLLDGEPVGALIDVGCGTGSYAAGLGARGWQVTGIDVSEDMLRRAQAKGIHALHADAASLPFMDASFDAAVSIFTHTDFDDPRAVIGEVARVLRPAAPFVYIGAHPCFVGPHSTYDIERGVPDLHTGWYRRAGRYTEAPGISRSSGLRMRVGANHLALAAFIQTFLDVGLQLERIEEPEKREYPYVLALRWRR